MTDLNSATKRTPVPDGTAAAPLPTPVVNEVHFAPRPESRLFGHLEGESLGTEQYRLLHHRLLHLQAQMPLKRLLVASAGRGEGKTHVATNLALTIARETDCKVLIVDADVRKPDVHNIYGIPNDYGLLEILRNGHETWKAVRKVAGLNLYVLTAGSSVSERLATSSVLTLKILLDQVNSAFDWVIIDSPPVLLAADVPLLARLADGVLLVVRAHQTPRELVQRAKEMLESATLVGTVLNGGSPTRSSYGSYYGPYYGKDSKKNKSTSHKDKGQNAPGLKLK